MKEITREELHKMSWLNSKAMPQTVNDGGVRKQWVGIGWVLEGPADGTEEAKVLED